MDENTRFVVTQMNEGFAELRKEIHEVRKDLAGLRLFKERVVGASVGLSMFVTMAINYVKEIPGIK